MINEKELRVGNYYANSRNLEMKIKAFDTINKFVLVDGQNTEIETTSTNQNTVIFEDLNPVELSEARLNSLGFLEDNAHSLSITSDNNAHFIWDGQRKEITIKDGEKGAIGQPIKYLHQLQNVYYYLTGKEFAGS